MRKRNSSYIALTIERLSLVVLLAVVVSCKPSVPRKYIQPGKMEKILYDYHLMDAMSNADGKESAVAHLASHEAVLKKHGITQAEFDSSMVYYFRHTERLHHIYENLAKRLSEESKSLGGNATNDYTSLSAKGDTANIWQGNRSEILLPSPPDNKLSFYIKADTSFHQGDRILFNFKNQFIFQEGIKDAIAILCVRFKNDSIATQVRHFSANGLTSIKLEDSYKEGIKEIRGYISLVNRLNEKSQTYKLLSVFDIQLIRMHINANHLEPGTERVDEDLLEEPQGIERIPLPRERQAEALSHPSIPQDAPLKEAIQRVKPEKAVVEEDAPSIQEQRLPIPKRKR